VLFLLVQVIELMLMKLQLLILNKQLLLPEHGLSVTLLLISKPKAIQRTRIVTTEPSTSYPNGVITLVGEICLELNLMSLKVSSTSVYM
jgi:hypothetical protein